MMNCLKCPYAKRHDAKIYCPFFEVRECPLMGEHYIPLAVPKKPVKVAIKKVAEKVEAADTQPSYIPAYKPMHKAGRDAKIPWSDHHTYIFQSLHDGKGPNAIARQIGVPISTLRNYLRRYSGY